jgi:decaprenyl-phosphate phosphoribosyltransferase
MTPQAIERNESFTWMERLKAHIAILRIDHWTKNVFVLPGVVIPLTIHQGVSGELIQRLILGTISVCLVASSNYTINEILDAPHDRLHPVKKMRPAARGLINLPLGYAQWILLMLTAVGIGRYVNRLFCLTVLALWIMGCLYNIRPIRTKEVPYLDVLSESVNNPLRMLAGWYMVTDTLVPPVSLLICYWMFGAYFMALKRFSELREIGDKKKAAAYRRSFRYYTERSLLVSVLFYGSSAMLFFGAFLIRYRIELVLTFPLVALVMAVYCNIAFETNSAAQHPEYLYRNKLLMICVVSCSIAMLALLKYDIPALNRIFTPTLPVRW